VVIFVIIVPVQLSGCNIMCVNKHIVLAIRFSFKENLFLYSKNKILIDFYK